MQFTIMKKKDLVLLSWGIIILGLMFLWLSIAGGYAPKRVEWFWPITLSSITISVSIATALALGLKNLLLALPGCLFPFFVMGYIILAGKFVDMRPVILGLLFFLFFLTCGALLIRACRDEIKSLKIYQGSLLGVLLFMGTSLLLFFY